MLNLEQLQLVNAKLGAGFSAPFVDSCPGIKQLELSRSTVTNSGRTYIAKLQQLESLRLNETQVGDNGLAKLDNSQNVTHVSVNVVTVTSDGERRFKEKHPEVDLTRQ